MDNRDHMPSWRAACPAIIVTLVVDHGRLVLAVLHPPPAWTLNARLIAWQQSRRDQATSATLAPTLTRIASSGLPEWGVQVHTTTCRQSRRPGERDRRTATALLRLCRNERADVLVLPADLHGDVLTPRCQRHLIDLAPPGLRIRRSDDHTLPDMVLL